MSFIEARENELWRNVMLALVKMSALSAVLSFGAVQAYERTISPMDGAPSGKAFHDRILPSSGPAATALKTVERDVVSAPVAAGARKGDRIAVVPTNCADQEWPYVAADCLSRNDGHNKPSRVRMITIERREAANVSVLQRVPPTAVANR
jgi:hypothetical protein